MHSKEQTGTNQCINIALVYIFLTTWWYSV